MKNYAIQNLRTKDFLKLGQGVRWLPSAHLAERFRLPETARAVARSLVSRYSISYVTGRMTRTECLEMRLTIVPLLGETNSKAR